VNGLLEIGGWKMEDEGVGGRTSLGGKYLFHGVGVQAHSGQSVDGFSGDGDHLAGMEELHRLLQAAGIGGK
jgi:hypothetical protein